MSSQLIFNKSTVFFGHLADSGFDELLKKKYPGSKMIILTDENVAANWVEYMVTEFEVLFKAEIMQLPSGENAKNIETCTSVWEAFSEYEIARNDVIINLGGGVITDMGGFIASTFKRGLRFINIPTTLLGQVDAALGGKTGVDIGPFKNQVGTFAQADMVFIDPRFLATLEKEQLYSGYAEMLKHGLIADQKYWKELLAVSPDSLPDLLPFIERSVGIKKSIVEQDYDEKGARKTLNFGHTIGHAMEGFFLAKNGPLLHGYAVAHGMVAESYISFKKGLLPEADMQEIKVEIEKRFGKPAFEKFAIHAIIDLMKNDKKNLNSHINFTLLNGVGQAVYDQDASEQLIREALRFII